MDVSVVVPALNEEQYIKRCLDALKSQKFGGSFEIIVSDGESKDGTVRIAKKIADKVVVEKTHTIASGRQRGVAAAKGGIIAFTDADAIPHQHWLEELCKPFSDEKVVATYGNILLYDGTGFETRICRDLFPPYFQLLQLLGAPGATGSNMAVRASALKKIGGFNVHLTAGEDIELQKRLKREGKIEYCPKAVVEVSARRIHKWGLPKFFAYHALNTLKIHFFGKSGGKYEPVR